MKTVMNWFEVPVTDLERARRFYETVLGTTLRTESLRRPMAFFPETEALGGALVKDPSFQPGADGPVIFLNADGALDACVRRVGPAGGRVVVPLVDIGPHGRFAILLDTEGNRIGLHDRTVAARG